MFGARDRIRRAVAAAVLAGAVGTGACGGDPEREAGDAPADSARAPSDVPATELPAEALTGGREPAALPDQWPAEIPLPQGAALLEAAQAPGPEITDAYLYLRVAGDLVDTLATLADTFTAGGFDEPELQVTGSSGRLATDGHGYRVAVEGRVSDEHSGVLDLSYRVSSTG